MQIFLFEKLNKIGNITSYDSTIVIDTINSSLDVKLYPGLIVATDCGYCKKRTFEKPIIKTIDGSKLHFCCNTCAKVYIKSIK